LVEFFIRRPIFATVCALLIVLAGAVSVPSIPISLYPQLAPPQVVVSSNYIGANSQDVESAVTTILEQAINGVEGMRYMSSTSSNDGTSTITITFDTGYDLDIAAVDVLLRSTIPAYRSPRRTRTSYSPLALSRRTIRFLRRSSRTIWMFTSRTR
jgi:HAE1 family hydrophobic/amphiphilic exporter-1